MMFRIPSFSVANPYLIGAVAVIGGILWNSQSKKAKARKLEEQEAEAKRLEEQEAEAKRLEEQEAEAKSLEQNLKSKRQN